MLTPRPGRHQDSFVQHILELLRPLKGVSARKIFGGHGLFKDGAMFAIVSNDELFFKVTDASRPDFLKRNLRAFTYWRRGKDIALSYHAAPAECLDDSRVMVEWAERAVQAARTSAEEMPRNPNPYRSRGRFTKKPPTNDRARKR